MNQFAPAKNLAVLAASVWLYACGNEQQAETPVADTVEKVVTITDTVVKTAVVDTAAIIAFYEAAHAKSKGSHTAAHKPHQTKKDKHIVVDAHPAIEHHDAMPAVVAAPADASTAEPAKAAEPVVVVVHDVQKVYFRPDEKASFPGGEKAFDEYLMKNIQYPDAALDNNVEGTVFAQVTLDEQGNVKDVSFLNDRLGYGLNSEAVRLLKSSPRWNPARHAGVPVSSKFTVPIRFDIK